MQFMKKNHKKNIVLGILNVFILVSLNNIRDILMKAEGLFGGTDFSSPESLLSALPGATALDNKLQTSIVYFLIAVLLFLGVCVYFIYLFIKNYNKKIVDIYLVALFLISALTLIQFVRLGFVISSILSDDFDSMFNALLDLPSILKSLTFWGIALQWGSLGFIVYTDYQGLFKKVKFENGKITLNISELDVDNKVKSIDKEVNENLIVKEDKSQDSSISEFELKKVKLVALKTLDNFVNTSKRIFKVILTFFKIKALPLAFKHKIVLGLLFVVVLVGSGFILFKPIPKYSMNEKIPFIDGIEMTVIDGLYVTEDLYGRKLELQTGYKEVLVLLKLTSKSGYPEIYNSSSEFVLSDGTKEYAENIGDFAHSDLGSRIFSGSTIYPDNQDTFILVFDVYEKSLENELMLINRNQIYLEKSDTLKYEDTFIVDIKVKNFDGLTGSVTYDSDEYSLSYYPYPTEILIFGNEYYYEKETWNWFSGTQTTNEILKSSNGQILIGLNEEYNEDFPLYILKDGVENLLDLNKLYFYHSGLSFYEIDDKFWGAEMIYYKTRDRKNEIRIPIYVSDNR